MSKKLGKRVTLSEQQIVDCSTSNYGCRGGDPRIAYNDILTKSSFFYAKAVDLSDVYPVYFFLFLFWVMTHKKKKSQMML